MKELSPSQRQLLRALYTASTEGREAVILKPQEARCAKPLIARGWIDQRAGRYLPHYSITAQGRFYCVLQKVV
jgi:hypothetical protein